jgi:hypothetical protein
VNRRAPLPGAAELFRSTGRVEGDTGWFDPARPAPSSNHRATAPSGPRGTGRQKHDTKITVYVSDQELLALEQARLTLRAGHGLAVDRGRVVREAIAVLLADFDERGEESVLVRRLRQDEQQ